MRGTRRSLIAALLATGCAWGQTGHPTQEVALSPGEVDTALRTLSEELKDRYVLDNQVAGTLARIEARRKAGAYSELRLAEHLAAALTEDLQALTKDKHLRVFWRSNPIPTTAEDLPPDVRGLGREQLARENFGFKTVEILDGNIGYLDLRRFVNPAWAGDTAVSTMNFLANADALIVDLRHNGGGSPLMIALLSSYFFDEPVHLNDLYDRRRGTTRQSWTLPHVPGKKFLNKDIFVLTTASTFSAAEEFSYNLKNLKRAVLIGETTRGGAHPVVSRRLSDHLFATVPYARAISPITKTNWEGTGVTPDFPMPAPESLVAAHRLALRRLAETTSDPDLVQKLKSIAETLKDKER